MRDAPALDILRGALREGARLRVFDPAAMETSRPALGDERVAWCADAYDAAQGADLLVIFTEWNQFRNLDLDRLKSLLAAPRVVDCRNIYDPQRMRAAGFEYLGVGR